MMLDGKIVLCSHSDSSFNRHYNGGLAQLSIYDSALQPVEIRALYNQVSCGLQVAAFCCPAGVLTPCQLLLHPGHLQVSYR